MSRARVLIVEDDQALRETTNEILTDEGFEVVEAADGEAALAVLSRASVDVLLLDLAMPRLSGVEVLRRIEAPPPMVIVCSALVLFDEGELRQQAGHKLFRVLRKPVGPSELISVVSQATQDGATTD